MSNPSGSMNKLTAYEKKQIKAINAWKNEEPGVVNKSFGLLLEPLAWLVQKVVPEQAMIKVCKIVKTFQAA